MAVPLLVDERFQVYFTPLTGVLFTFPSRYWYTIGRQGVFSLGRWSSQIQTGFRVSRPTQVLHVPLLDFAYEAVTRYGRTFQTVLLSTHGSRIGALQPRLPVDKRFRLVRVRSPLLTESLLISSPSGTEMFHFPEFASKSLCIQQLDD